MTSTLDKLEQKKTLANLLRRENTVSLATVNERGEACVTPLFYIVDEKLSLFWLSSATSLHSQNLKKTARASATVYLHTESWKEIHGVQMRGVVALISNRTRRRLLIKSYAERFKLGALFLPAMSRCSLYEFRPEFFRFIDNSKGFGNKFEATPAEIGLAG
jgi:uncharacterized protein YhbP (UPF0306 family)